MEPALWMLPPRFAAADTWLLAFLMLPRMEVMLAQRARGPGGIARRVGRGEARAGSIYGNAAARSGSYRKAESLENFLGELSNWIEHEIAVDEGADVGRLAQDITLFDKGVVSISNARLKRALA